MKEFKDFIFCFLKKLFSKNFMLPVLCAILIYKTALSITDVSVLKIVCLALVTIATGFNVLGVGAEFVRGKNGKT